jgi:RHS repeat-associated protein
MTRRQKVNASDDDGELHEGERTWYVYDANGQRVRKVTELATGAVKDERLYLGEVEIYRRRGANELVRETLHIMDDRQRIALVETRSKGSEDGVPPQLIRYQLGDHVGSTRLELDDMARVISYEEYLPFGATSYQATAKGIRAAAKRYRFTGQERDEETGLNYHHVRYYATWLGRWTAADPIGVEGDVNLYAYVHNSPLNSIDPSGTEDSPTPTGTGPGTLTKIGWAISFAVLLITDKTPEQHMEPLVTIYGSHGMVAKAAEKAVDLAQGVHKPDEAYTTEAEHAKQLNAIVTLGAWLFPGIEPIHINVPGPPLALADAHAVGALATTQMVTPRIPMGAPMLMSSTTKRASGTPPAASRTPGRAPTGKPQWWLKNSPTLQARLNASHKGYQVYVLRGSEGEVLYVGKSGGAEGLKPSTWEDRVRAHIKDVTKKDWIGAVDTIAVASELTEMEAFAAEQDLIRRHELTSFNRDPGEFTKRFPEADLAANVKSAGTKPTFEFQTDIVP